MTRPFAAFMATLGLAIVITALTLPQRNAPAVINSLSWGGVHLTEAALGQHP